MNQGRTTMKVMYKYPVPFSTAVPIPQQTQGSFVGMQDGVVTLWMPVSPYAEKTHLAFVVSTGIRFGEEGTEYLGSCQDGEFVWHVCAEAKP